MSGALRRMPTWVDSRRSANQFSTGQPIFRPTNFSKEASMAANQPIQITFAVGVDVDAWCTEYGVARGDVAKDVVTYLATALQGTHAAEHGLLSISRCDGGIHISAERLQLIWNDLRARYDEAVAHPSSGVASQVLAARQVRLDRGIFRYAHLVGISNDDVREYLRQGHTNAPTMPLGEPQ
jgi:hypothetical protein